MLFVTELGGEQSWPSGFEDHGLGGKASVVAFGRWRGKKTQVRKVDGGLQVKFRRTAKWRGEGKTKLK